MKKMHLFGIAIRRRKRYSSYRGTVGEIKPNLICRNFLAILPDRKWYSDITEFHLNGEKLYLSPIMDGCTHEIISYTLSRRPVLEQVMTMLDLAYKAHPALKGNSLDDGLMEGFFGILKREMWYGFEKNFKNLDELEDAIKEYIYYYNNFRIKSSIKNHTPIQYRNMVLNQTV